VATSVTDISVLLPTCFFVGVVAESLRHLLPMRDQYQYYEIADQIKPSP
jgi:hypothetical protein